MTDIDTITIDWSYLNCVSFIAMEPVKHVSYATEVQTRRITDNTPLEPLPRIQPASDVTERHEEPETTELKYLAFLRKRDDEEGPPKPCLPPLIIRNVQGKYGGVSGSLTSSPTRERTPSSRSRKQPTNRAQSVPVDIGKAKKCEMTLPRSNTEILDNNRFNFPREFWEGPLFKIYRSTPKLTASMNLHRVKALRSLLHVNDFEGKTGFSETNYDTGGDGLVDLLEMARWARQKRDLNRPGPKMGSAHNQRKSIVNRLPTISD